MKYTNEEVLNGLHYILTLKHFTDTGKVIAPATKLKKENDKIILTLDNGQEIIYTAKIK